MVVRREITHITGTISKNYPGRRNECMRRVLCLHERNHQQHCQTIQGQAKYRPTYFVSRVAIRDCYEELEIQFCNGSQVKSDELWLMTRSSPR
jgi:hypothetical protein